MTYRVLQEELSFPDIHTADKEGLVAIGGDLSVARLQMAYQQGIFPWYNEDEPILWWSPDPRCVIYTDQIHISRSMRSTLQNPDYRFSINEAFHEVIHLCSQIERKGQSGTWLLDDMKNAYIQLYNEGWAYSAECWFQGKLVGGLYGILMPSVFCGESMFSLIPNTSKYTLIKMAQWLQQQQVPIIDCQIPNPHLMRMGATLISRKEFQRFLPGFNYSEK